MPKERILPPKKIRVPPGAMRRTRRPLLHSVATPGERAPLMAPHDAHLTSSNVDAGSKRAPNLAPHDATAPTSEENIDRGGPAQNAPRKGRCQTWTPQNESYWWFARPAPPSAPPLGRPEAGGAATEVANPPAARAGAKTLTSSSTMPLTFGGGP